MPRFLTISPTHVEGEKEFAWNNFLKGGYIAIGWGHTDYSNFSIEQIIKDLKSKGFRNESDAIDSFKKFKELRSGDIVAVNNVNYGLYGVGRIDRGYNFQKQFHDSGSDDTLDFYSHIRYVKWIVKEYHLKEDIIMPGEKMWAGRGTMGSMQESLPPYILRLLDRHIPIDYSKIEVINNVFDSFFKNGEKECEVGDIMPDLINNKLFSQENGSDFREFLRNLYTVERLHLIPYAHFNFEPSSKHWYFLPVDNQSINTESELIGYEGRVRSEIREHKWIERDLFLVRNYKLLFADIDKCQGCNVKPQDVYEIKAIDFLELHHITPLKLRKGEKNTITKPSDLALLCPNCHRAIHKLMSIQNDKVITIEELKERINN